MSRKSKGINAERELVHLLFAKGWVASRVAGSGCIQHPSPDVITGKEGKIFVLECKTTGDEYKSLCKEEVEELVFYAKIMYATPIIAVKFDRKGWYFNYAKDMRQTEKGFCVTLEEAQQSWKNFDSIFH